VSDSAEVVVFAPYKLSRLRIDHFIAAKQHWIAKHVASVACLPQPVREHTYTTGDEFLFGGELLKLCVIESVPVKTICIRKNEFLIVHKGPQAKTAAVQKAIIAWYKSEGLTLYQYFVSHWSLTLGLKFVPGTNLAGFPKRWGSCSKSGEIRFAFRSLMLPLHVMNYLALHEVAHVLHFNHGAQYKQILHTHMPHWRSFQQEMNHLRVQVSRF
jgi:predicted metal-dependent hydrolase